MPTAAAHRFLEHTSEVELELQAPSRDALFAEAVAAIGELLAAPRGAPVTDVREISAVGDDDGALLVAWLDEIDFLAESEGLIPSAAEQVHVADGAVAGRVRAARGAPPHLVKGITYHPAHRFRSNAVACHVPGRFHGFRYEPVIRLSRLAVCSLSQFNNDPLGILAA